MDQDFSPCTEANVIRYLPAYRYTIPKPPFTDTASELILSPPQSRYRQVIRPVTRLVVPIHTDSDIIHKVNISYRPIVNRQQPVYSRLVDLASIDPIFKVAQIEMSQYQAIINRRYRRAIPNWILEKYTNQFILGLATIVTNQFPIPTPDSRIFRLDARSDVFTVVIDNRIYYVFKRR